MLIGLGAAVVIAAALVAPVVLSSGGGGKPCAATLVYGGRTYVAREAGGFVQAIAIGVAVAHGCGAPPANVDVRSLAGVPASRAIGISTDQSSVYVRRGVCAQASSTALLDCLK
jgi:hypothetical protein